LTHAQQNSINRDFVIVLDHLLPSLPTTFWTHTGWIARERLRLEEVLVLHTDADAKSIIQGVEIRIVKEMILLNLLLIRDLEYNR